MSITKISPSVVDFDSGITITVDDTSAALTIKSTDAGASSSPILDFVRDSASPADSDALGFIRFKADNDAGEETLLANIKATAVDVSDGSEDGRLLLQTMIDGTTRNRIEITNTEVVVNQSGVDSDFRVESDGNANTFIVDAGTDEVRIPHNVAAQTVASFNVRENGAALEYGHQNNTGQYYGTLGAFGSNGDPYIGFATDCESSANTFTTRGSKGCLITNGSGDMRFMAVTSASATGQTPAERVRIRNDGGITFNGDTAAANALDDYEEGTWTPTLESYQGNTLNLSSYTSNGTYTKIGRQVTVMIYITSLTFNSGTNTDYIQITLPFSAHGGSAMVTNSYGAGSLTSSVVDFDHEHSRPSFLTTSKLGFLGSNQDGGTWAWEPYSSLPTSGSTAAFRVTFTYFVA